ncbi:unnamed protein product [Clonostachys rhizophaga]|uniref:Uncharacterized protein n=1 Tax=Clonostachys rhizophaga TaxID=160324 RepID=A0A9N9YL63_9HYPO|nr:unnamed protein product [Clonostachys rhizophaga]
MPLYMSNFADMLASQRGYGAVETIIPLENGSGHDHGIDLVNSPVDISALPPFTSELTPELTPHDIEDKIASDDRNYINLLGSFIECIHRGIFLLSLTKAKHPAASKIGDELGDKLDQLKVEVDAIFTRHSFFKLETRLSAIVKLVSTISSDLRVVPSVGAESLSTDAVGYTKRGRKNFIMALRIVRQVWDVCFFPDLNDFRGILDGPFESFLTVTASSQDAFANTVECYVTWRWGKRGMNILSWLARLLSVSPNQHPNTEPVCVELRGWIAEKPATSLSNRGDITLRIRWIEGRLEDYYVQVADIASQLAWVVAALKEPPSTTVSFTRARIEYLQDKESFCPYFQIAHEDASSQLLGDGEDTCWHQLFTELNVAVGFPVPERPEKMGGVELPLPLMTTFANIGYPVAYRDGFILKGWQNALFPIRTDSDSCLSKAVSNLQWHLFRSAKERLYMTEVKELKPDLRPVKAQLSQEEFINAIKQTKRHFLGLYESATVRIGTDDSRLDNIDHVHVDDGLKERRLKSLVCWNRNINASAGGGFGGSSIGVSTGIRLRTKKERQLRLGVEVTMDKLIKMTLTNSTMLYNIQTKVSWMLPQICVILYLIQAWAKQYAPANAHIHYPTFDTYEKNLHDLKNVLESFWRDDTAQKAHLDLKEAFIYYAQALDELQDDEDLKPAKGINPSKLAGVDFTTLANQPRSYSIVTVNLNNQTCGDWLQMLKSDWKDTTLRGAPYRVVTLFCANLPRPPVQPLPPPMLAATPSRL